MSLATTKKTEKIQPLIIVGIVALVVLMLALVTYNSGDEQITDEMDPSSIPLIPDDEISPKPTIGAESSDSTPSDVTLDPDNSSGINVEERSVVQIRVFEGGIECWGASGVIFPTAEFVITNDHVVSPDEDCRPDDFEIWLTTNNSQSVKRAYRAEVINSDYASDLGILRIINLGNNSEGLKPLKESNFQNIGDEILVYGFPGIAGDSLTVSKGIISGFIRQEGSNWIKTDAAISGGSSGGPAVNRNRELIGLVSQAGSSSDGSVVDCRLVEDTNNDGYIDENDTCVPIGSSFSLLVPLENIKQLISLTPEIK